jgi:hypothetical protein
MITLHNLSADPAVIPLEGDLAGLTGAVEVLGEPEPPGQSAAEITLGRYGFRWLRLPD